MHIKDALLLIRKYYHVAVAGYLSRCLSGPLLYPTFRRHITVNKMHESFEISVLVSGTSITNTLGIQTFL